MNPYFSFRNVRNRAFYFIFSHLHQAKAFRSEMLLISKSYLRLFLTAECVMHIIMDGGCFSMWDMKKLMYLDFRIIRGQMLRVYYHKLDLLIYFLSKMPNGYSWQRDS